MCVELTPFASSRPGFLFLFRKKKMGGVKLPISAIKLPVADFCRQTASCFQNGNNSFDDEAKHIAVCVDNDSSSAELWHCP